MGNRKPERNEVINLLTDKRAELLSTWHENIRSIRENLHLGYLPHGNALPISLEELDDFLTAYLEDLHKGQSHQSEEYLLDLVERKIAAGWSLTFLELINSTFVNAVRVMVRGTFPDSFDSRAQYMEWISELVSRNDLRLAHKYETLLGKLTKELMERQRELEGHNAMMQQFFDVASHEFQAPLWSILGHASKLISHYSPHIGEKGMHGLARIQDNVREMHLLIQGFARLLSVTSFSSQVSEFSLQHVMRSALNRIRREMEKEVEVQLPAGLPRMVGNRQQIEHLFYELLRNAILFADEARENIVEVAFEDSEGPREACRIWVKDRGIGIPQEYAELVWKPLERLNDIQVEGLGLGLAYVKRVVEVHGGQVRIVPEYSPGTCVEVVLPKSRPHEHVHIH